MYKSENVCTSRLLTKETSTYPTKRCPRKISFRSNREKFMVAEKRGCKSHSISVRLSGVASQPGRYLTKDGEKGCNDISSIRSALASSRIPAGCAELYGHLVTSRRPENSAAAQSLRWGRAGMMEAGFLNLSARRLLRIAVLIEVFRQNDGLVIN